MRVLDRAVLGAMMGGIARVVERKAMKGLKRESREAPEGGSRAAPKP
ncbi:MAG: hypothetical protein HY775_02695 [Acidobacteria bacterium]|nr:hypothetical protein [Acidobacteriota bacterium]